MLGVLYKKCILGSYGQEFGSEMRFRDSWKFLSSSTSRLAFLDLTPDSRFEQLSTTAAQKAYFRSKKAKREVYELDPPLLGPQPRILGRLI